MTGAMLPCVSEQTAIDHEQFDRLRLLEMGQSRMEAQHEHLDKCMDGVKDELHSLRDELHDFHAESRENYTKLTVKLYGLTAGAAAGGAALGSLTERLLQL